MKDVYYLQAVIDRSITTRKLNLQSLPEHVCPVSQTDDFKEGEQAGVLI